MGSGNYLSYVKYLEKCLPSKFIALEFGKDYINGIIPRDSIYNLLYFLNKHSHCQFKVLTDITAVDWLGRSADKLISSKLKGFEADVRFCRVMSLESRFCLVYNLLSTRYNFRLILKSFVGSTNTVDSVTNIYKSANWWERETWDMFGIIFNNHPDLRRLLTDYGFEGHPLRKDFPLSGYTEIRYDEGEKKIVYEPVEFLQEFRNFDYTTPWTQL